MDRPRVVIVGGGMGGLATALALKDSGHDVLVLERDAEPPEIEPNSAFDAWNRPGVPQLRHTHIFLARLQTILRDRHPDFLSELRQAGIERSSIDEVLPAGVAESWRAEKKDDDLLHLWGRRATFEYALRRHVAGLGHVRFVHDVRVERLVVEKEDGHVRVRGVEVRRGGENETIFADVVVDASGVHSKITDRLRADGAAIDVQRKPSPCAYYCRHYVQRDPTEKLPRTGTGAHVDYLVFGTFFAERGTFSIAFACPEVEEELCATLRRPEGFDAVCRRIPALERSVSRAEPASKVFGGGGLANRWTKYSRTGAQVLGFFPVGDSYIVTNPIYGRGCSMAFVEAHALAEVLRETSNPLARARRYHRRVHRLLRPHFDFCVAADHGFSVRATMARGEAVSPFDRFVSQLLESVLTPALDEKPAVAREWIRAQQLREVSPPWVAILFLLYTLFLWAVRTLKRAERPVQAFAPSRTEMLRSLEPLAAPSLPPPEAVPSVTASSLSHASPSSFPPPPDASSPSSLPPPPDSGISAPSSFPPPPPPVELAAPSPPSPVPYVPVRS